MSRDYENFKPSYRSTEDVFSPVHKLQRSPVQTRRVLRSNTKEEENKIEEEKQLEARKFEQEKKKEEKKKEDNKKEDKKKEDKKKEEKEKEITKKTEKIRKEIGTNTSPNRLHSQNSSPERPALTMNTTIKEATQTDKTPRVPKFVSPTIFNPVSSNAASFLNIYERCAAANGWNEAYKIAYLGTFLEAPASTWFYKYTSQVGNEEKTWMNLKDDFIKEFGGENAARKSRMSFNRRKQADSEDIKRYFFELQQLAEEVDPNMDFSTFRDRFESGLHPAFQEAYYLIAPEDMKMPQLKNIVFRLSDVKEMVLSAQIE